MPELDDSQLLCRYAEEGSEEAFAEIVSRHVGLVYSAALRSVGKPQAAQDITQAVFIILAKKARRIPKGSVLAGWLYQTTRLTVANYRRAEIRRQKREQEACVQSTLNESESASDAEAWSQISPLLDAAMAKLGARDRSAIVLRFFENKTLSEIGAALGASEDAAKMRVHRALEKLRRFFVQRGVTLSAAAIGATVLAHSVQAAPIGLAQSVSAIGAAKGAAASASTLTLVKGALKLMAWSHTKAVLLTGAALLLAAGTTTLAVKSLGQDLPDGPRLLRRHWELGKQYALHLELDQRMESTVQAQSVKQEIRLQQDFTLTPATNDESGGWRLDLQFGAQAMDFALNGRKTVSFDSAQSRERDPGNPVAPTLRAIEGSTLRYYTDPTGKIERLDGGEELRKRVAGTADPHQQDALDQVLRASFGQSLSNANLQEMYGTFGSMIPDHPVKIGDHWRISRERTSAIGLLAVNTEYTFKSWDQRAGHKCAHLGVLGDISNKTTATTLGAAVQIQQGKIAGDIWFDPELGAVREVNTDERRTLKINMRGQSLLEQESAAIRVVLVEVSDAVARH